MSLSSPHRDAFRTPEPFGPVPGREAEWRTLRLELPETAILLTVRPAPGERVLIALNPPALARAADAEPAHFPVSLEPGIATALARAAEAGEGALSGISGRPEIRRLSAALAAARASGQPVQQLYAQSIGSAIAARVMEHAEARPARRPVAPLPKWRLDKVLRHLEENLAERLSLADLARAAGLTRMYFATQFRASLGVSPHAYVLRRRIARAQHLLERSNESLVNVALDVGFQTQAHFTTVFKRFVGETPARWRQIHAGRPASGPTFRRAVATAEAR